MRKPQLLSVSLHLKRIDCTCIFLTTPTFCPLAKQRKDKKTRTAIARPGSCPRAKELIIKGATWHDRVTDASCPSDVYLYVFRRWHVVLYGTTNQIACFSLSQFSTSSFVQWGLGSWQDSLRSCFRARGQQEGLPSTKTVRPTDVGTYYSGGKNWSSG